MSTTTVTLREFLAAHEDKNLVNMFALQQVPAMDEPVAVMLHAGFASEAEVAVPLPDNGWAAVQHEEGFSLRRDGVLFAVMLCCRGDLTVMFDHAFYYTVNNPRFPGVTKDEWVTHIAVKHGKRDLENEEHGRLMTLELGAVPEDEGCLAQMKEMAKDNS